MSLIKIPLLFLASALHDKAFTPPNPPPKSQRNDKGWVEKTLFRSIAFVTIGQKAMVHFVGIAEAAAVIASKNPEWEYSRPILNHLVLPGIGSVSNMLPITPGFWIGTSLVITGITVQGNHKLITSGPYNVVRHPSYAGVLIIVAGIFIWQGSKGSWIRESGILDTWVGKGLVFAGAAWQIVLSIGGINRAIAEDGMLEEEFGDEWRAWSKKVPYLLFPMIF